MLVTAHGHARVKNKKHVFVIPIMLFIFNLQRKKELGN
jgi:hypothetical protein